MPDHLIPSDSAFFKIKVFKYNAKLNADTNAAPIQFYVKGDDIPLNRKVGDIKVELVGTGYDYTSQLTDGNVFQI